MALELGLAALPRLLAGFVLLALALALALLNFSHRANRAFALFLLLASLGYVTFTLGGLATDYATGAYWFNLSPYFTLALPFVIMHFASVYPQRRGWLMRRRVALPLFILGALALETAYLLDHEWFWTLARNEAGRAVVAERHLLSHLVTAGLYLAYGLAALLFAWDFTRAPPGPLRRQLRLISLGAALYLAWISTYKVLQLAGDGWGPPGESLGLVPLAALVVLLLRHVRQARDPELEVLSRRYLYALAFPLAAALGAFLMKDAAPLLHAIFDGLWVLLFPLLVSFALVRYQLFDIEIKIKWTLRQSTLFATVLAVYFIVSESAAQYVNAETESQYVGILAAGLLMFFLAPLQRFAERVSSAALPGVSGSPEYVAFKKLEVYQAAYEGLLVDGTLTDKERVTLNRLREKLRIRPQDAAQVEHDVTEAFSQTKDAAPPGVRGAASR